LVESKLKWVCIRGLENEKKKKKKRKRERVKKQEMIEGRNAELTVRVLDLMDLEDESEG